MDQTRGYAAKSSAFYGVPYEDITPKMWDDARSTIKDSGVREEFSTGSVRDTRDGKGRFDLIPPSFLYRLARHFEEGAKKYGDNNWQRGQNLSRYIDSCMRHINKHRSGHRDEDHLIAAVWNLLAYMWTEEQISIGELPEELAN